MTDKRKVVSVVGDSSLEPGDPRMAAAERVGELLADHGYRVMTGGLGGAMEAACRGARRSAAWTPGTTIGVLPGTDPAEANEFVDVVLPTGLDHGRNVIVAQADAVVAIGGGAGSLSEVALAWAHKRLVLAMRCDGWSGRLADAPVDGRRRYPAIEDDRVYGFQSPDEVPELLSRLLPLYDGHHRGIRRRRP
ncbi:MAG: TIGR00725 family protein [Planctomycetes bacterium]|nr:TIGR00725 family protein [Planctomycetota bacterium]